MNTLNTNEVLGDEEIIEATFRTMTNQALHAQLQAEKAEVNAAANGTLFEQLAAYIASLEARIATLERVKPTEPGDLVQVVEAVLVQSTWFSGMVKTNVQEEIDDIDLEQMVEQKVSNELETAIDEYDFTDKVEEIVGNMDLDDKVETIVNAMDLDKTVEKVLDEYDFDKLFRQATISFSF